MNETTPGRLMEVKAHLLKARELVNLIMEDEEDGLVETELSEFDKILSSTRIAIMAVNKLS